ncbi:Mis6-domain-containing protein [Lineolata rhizophorae]|uniref:Mis6-domain-containing protein n=1 Tax=Lineolata rhizophorae TaxID=578093 RepID=A0A6A6NRU2_9PEZI|nr:Mis6-domain-containing protein [Lineolata rhizophorae]
MSADSSSGDDDDGRIASLRAALDAIDYASRVPARQRRGGAARLRAAVDFACQHAASRGLLPEELESVVDVVAVRSHLDQASCTALVRALYPAATVSAEVVVGVVGCFGQGATKPPPAVQAALARWLVNVHHVLEDPRSLACLYGVLFGLLDMISLRSPLCHLLSLLTRRKHVRPYRIQYLLELTRQLGPDPHLAGLLRVYKDYYPDIILGTPHSTKHPFSSKTDAEWRNKLRTIQEANSTHISSTEADSGFRMKRQNGHNSKGSILPELHTFYARETSVTLEEIDGVDRFVDNLERIELPNQLAASFRDPLLQKYLTLNPSKIASQRIELWLSQVFQDELECLRDGGGASAHLTEVLSALLKYTEYTNVIPPVAKNFLQRYLFLWDGTSNVKETTGLLSYLPVLPFEEIRRSFLDPLQRAISANPRAPGIIFTFFGDLIHNWVVLMISDPDSFDMVEETPRQSFVRLYEHASTVALSILSSAPDVHIPTTSAILTFYESATYAVSTSYASHSAVLPILCPPPHLIYLFLFSASAAELSRLCALLATIKRTYEVSLGHAITHSPADLAAFNGYLMDACNILWRARALLASDANAKGCLFPPRLLPPLQDYVARRDRDYGLAAFFGLSHNALLAGMAAAAFRRVEVERHALERGSVEEQDEDGDEDWTWHAGPVTQRSLVVLEKDGGAAVSWREYRVEVLRWLEERALGGVKELMYATMKDLMRVNA